MAKTAATKETYGDRALRLQIQAHLNLFVSVGFATPAKMAERSGMSVATINKLLDGRQSPLELNIRQMADLYTAAGMECKFDVIQRMVATDNESKPAPK